jgi:hypothetical protein
VDLTSKLQDLGNPQIDRPVGFRDLGFRIGLADRLVLCFGGSACYMVQPKSWQLSSTETNKINILIISWLWCLVCCGLFIGVYKWCHNSFKLHTISHSFLHLSCSLFLSLSLMPANLFICYFCLVKMLKLGLRVSLNKLNLSKQHLPHFWCQYEQ